MQKSQGFSWIRIDKYEFFKRQRPEPDVIEPVPERRLFVLQSLLDLIQNNQHRVDRRIETVCYTVLYRAFRRQANLSSSRFSQFRLWSVLFPHHLFPVKYGAAKTAPHGARGGRFSETPCRPFLGTGAARFCPMRADSTKTVGFIHTFFEYC